MTFLTRRFIYFPHSSRVFCPSTASTHISCSTFWCTARLPDLCSTKSLDGEELGRALRRTAKRRSRASCLSLPHGGSESNRLIPREFRDRSFASRSCDQLISPFISNSCFTSSEEWDKLRPAIEVWSERSHPLMAEILAKHEAGDPMTDQEFCERLEQFPFIGDFLQWQMMLDFAYFSDGLLKRTDYLVPGPGAKEGMDMFQVDGVAANDYEAKFDYLLEHVNKELAKEKLERYEPGSTGTDARIVRFQIGPVDLEHAL